jgi:hypothetical protein
MSSTNHLMKTDQFVACDIIKWLGATKVATQPPNVAQIGKKVQQGNHWH